MQERAKRNERVLVTTLTKKMAEDLTDYLQEMGVRVTTCTPRSTRSSASRSCATCARASTTCVVGINLLREGLDLPEVSLVCILDADKEGYLRSGGSLIQTIGRAARNAEGKVIMYADKVTDSMRFAIDETNRRRAIQEAHNVANGITPPGIQKSITRHHRPAAAGRRGAREYTAASELPNDELARLIRELESQMKTAARDLDYERAAILRDQIVDLRREQILENDRPEGLKEFIRPPSAPRPDQRRQRGGRTRPLPRRNG